MKYIFCTGACSGSVQSCQICQVKFSGFIHKSNILGFYKIAPIAGGAAGLFPQHAVNGGPCCQGPLSVDEVNNKIVRFIIIETWFFYIF